MDKTMKKYKENDIGDLLISKQSDIITLSFTMIDGTLLDIELNSNMVEYVKESLKVL